MSAGERSVVAAVATDDEPLFLPSWSAVSDRLDRTVESWRRWTDQISVGGRWAEAVRRSALALKLLLYEPGGHGGGGDDFAARTRRRTEKLGLPLRLGAGFVVRATR